MAWLDDQKAKLYSRPQVIELAGNGWQNVIIAGAEDLIPSHRYAVVCNGIVGSFVPHFPASDNVLEIGLRTDGSTWDVLLRMDMLYSPLFKTPGRPRGYPLHSVRMITVGGSPHPIELGVRMQGTGGVPSCHFDSPSVFLIDLDRLNSSQWKFFTDTSSTTLTGTVNGPNTLCTVGALNGLKPHYLSWVAEVESIGGIGWISCATLVTANDFGNDKYHPWTNHRLEAGTPMSHVGVRHRASSPARLADVTKHRLCFGSHIVAQQETGGSYPWSNVKVIGYDLADLPSSEPHNVITRVNVLAVEMEGLFSEEQLERDNAAATQSQRLFGHAEQWNEVVRGTGMITIPHEVSMIYSVRAKQLGRGPVGQLWHARTIQDINGIRMSPRDGNEPLGVQLVTRHECLEQTRASTFPALGQGRHCLRMWGLQDAPQLDDNGVYHYDLQLWTFLPRTGVTLPQGTSVEVGPEIQVHPGKESPPVHTLRPLPVAPNGIVTVERVRPVALSETPTGYVTAWPKIFTPREVVDLSWICTQSELEALRGFVRASPYSGGPLFRWKRPDDLAEKAWAFLVEGRRILSPTSEVADGRFVVSARVVELVYA